MGDVGGDLWRLLRQEELLGEIVIDDADFPWLHGQFAPTAAFEEVRPWFEESLKLLDAAAEDAEDDYERFEESYDRIAGALSLVAPTGPVAEFLLHIDGDRAWFRWSDEPF